MTPVDPQNQAGWDVFAPYGGLHVVSVIACLCVIAAVVMIGRRLDKRGERSLRYALSAFAISVSVLYNVAWNWNGIDPVTGLPLHICDIGGLIAPLALITLNRWLRATLYFWAIALTTQAFIQPTLTFGPSVALYWFFWIAHTVILGAAIYDIVVLRFRPDWSDFGRACAVTLGWLAVVMPINILFDANYGFIGDPKAKELIPPFVAALGPWPERVVVISALVGLGFLLALLPWRLAARERTAS